LKWAERQGRVRSREGAVGFRGVPVRNHHLHEMIHADCARWRLLTADMGDRGSCSGDVCHAARAAGVLPYTQSAPNPAAPVREPRAASADGPSCREPGVTRRVHVTSLVTSRRVPSRASMRYSHRSTLVFSGVGVSCRCDPARRRLVGRGAGSGSREVADLMVWRSSRHVWVLLLDHRRHRGGLPPPGQGPLRALGHALSHRRHRGPAGPALCPRQRRLGRFPRPPPPAPLPAALPHPRSRAHPVHRNSP